MDKARAKQLASLRDELAAREERDLSPLASRSSDATRQKVEEPGMFRTEYLRDRGRVIYSKYFRKLLNKTQAVLNPFDAAIHTRLTHSQEVAHIAKTIARGLRLNEDLAEAAALGHDIGHTPFGHAGEAALDACCGHFRHFEQSLRVVDILDNAGAGLNLTDHVRDAIVNHSKGKGSMINGHSQPHTLEGWCVRWADPIAYLVHDIEDALRTGDLVADALPSNAVGVLGTNASERLSVLTADLILNNRHLAKPKPELVEQAKISGIIPLAPRLSEEVASAFEDLRHFMYASVYQSPRKQRAESDVREVIEELYRYFLEKPELMDSQLFSEGQARGDELSRIVTDYIASLTDREAKRLYTEVTSSSNRVKVRAISI